MYTSLSEKFINYLLIDKKYSNNTIESYNNDLSKYLNFMNKKNIKFDNIKRNDILEYIKYLKDSNINEKSISHNISVIRSFYKFLMLEKYIESSPIEFIDLPKIKKTLPSVLSLDEVDKLLDIDLINNYSYRNKTMLELLYGSGLRVSELINIKLNDISFDECFIKVIGKGNKERIIPLLSMKIMNIYF